MPIFTDKQIETFLLQIKKSDKLFLQGHSNE